MERVAIRSKVLLAEDNEDVAEIMTMLLRRQGYTVETACDGLAAVELAAWFQPDIALLDIGMPRLDGYETARLIRQQLGSTVALVAVTALGSDRDKRLGREAGFDHHLVKPIDLEVLWKLLADLTANAPRFMA